MKPAEFRRVLEDIDTEGFDTVFVELEEYEDIDDKLFHKLRKSYLLARRKLAEYVGWDPDSV